MNRMPTWRHYTLLACADAQEHIPDYTSSSRRSAGFELDVVVRVLKPLVRRTQDMLQKDCVGYALRPGHEPGNDPTSFTRIGTGPGRQLRLNDSDVRV